MAPSEQVYQWAERHDDELLDNAEQGYPIRGFCIVCGAELYSGVDPDACGDTCECCGEPGVYGAEELMIYAFA